MKQNRPILSGGVIRSMILTAILIDDTAKGGLTQF